MFSSQPGATPKRDVLRKFLMVTSVNLRGTGLQRCGAVTAVFGPAPDIAPAIFSVTTISPIRRGRGVVLGLMGSPMKRRDFITLAGTAAV
jgi:hypothetical protein